jgi:hypothetical protein
MPSWNIALKYKRSAFSPPLTRLLEQDRAAQAKCQELVGLDFDPFLNTQDPAEHYVVREIARHDQYYVVDIYSVQFGEKSKEPSVRAEVSESDGHWFFDNFLYPGGRDLVTLLKLPRLPCSTPIHPGNK